MKLAGVHGAKDTSIHRMASAAVHLMSAATKETFINILVCMASYLRCWIAACQQCCMLSGVVLLQLQGLQDFHAASATHQMLQGWQVTHVFAFRVQPASRHAPGLRHDTQALHPGLFCGDHVQALQHDRPRCGYGNTCGATHLCSRGTCGSTETARMMTGECRAGLHGIAVPESELCREGTGSSYLTR